MPWYSGTEKAATVSFWAREVARDLEVREQLFPYLVQSLGSLSGSRWIWTSFLAGVESNSTMESFQAQEQGQDVWIPLLTSLPPSWACCRPPYLTVFPLPAFCCPSLPSPATEHLPMDDYYGSEDHMEAQCPLTLACLLAPLSFWPPQHSLWHICTSCLPGSAWESNTGLREDQAIQVFCVFHYRCTFDWLLKDCKSKHRNSTLVVVHNTSTTSAQLLLTLQVAVGSFSFQ